MKKQTLVILLVLTALIAGCIGAYAAAGDADDPIVTKSYVDQQISSLKSSVTQNDTFSVLHIAAGQMVIGGEGTEIILRSGEARIVAPGENGVSDITAGLDLTQGTRITTNHMLLTPRNDGRGLQAVTEAYLMVKGEYNLIA